MRWAGAIGVAPRDAADSVFGYLDRSAECGPDGVRWPTDDYPDEGVPYDGAVHYDAAVFLGVGGIPFFLADYHRLTGEPRALELALGAARWCSAPDRAYGGDPETPEALCFGRAGVGLAWVRLADAVGDGGRGECLRRARQFGERTLAADVGPTTDFIGGAAGEVGFLRLLDPQRVTPPLW